MEARQSDGTNPTPRYGERRFQFKASDGVARWTRIGLFACVVLSALAALSNLVHHGLLTDIQRGVVELVESEDEMNARDSGDLRQGLIALLQGLAFLATMIVFLVWTYRSNANLRASTNKVLEFRPGWAVGWYFVPIACLWKPYQAMKELWRRTAEDDERPEPIPVSMLVWWLTFNASTVISRISSRLGGWDPSIEVERRSIVLDIIASALLIPAGILLAQIVRRMQEMQNRVVERARESGAVVEATETAWH